MKNNQKGFGVVEILIIIVLVAGIVGLGWYVYRANQKTQVNSANRSNSSTTQNDRLQVGKNETKNILTLGDKVTLTLPDTWTAEVGQEKCLRFGELSCTSAAHITPGVKLPTRYGNGTEYFYILLSVFKNPQMHDAKTFLENDMYTGVGTGEVNVSTDPVNGYDSFHREQQYTGDGTTIREMDYVFSVKDQVIHIHARTYEPGKLNDGTQVGDFRQFESQIKDLAKTISIKS